MRGAVAHRRASRINAGRAPLVLVPPPFSPLDITSLRLWLDASDIVTLSLDTSGGRTSVDQWNDKSGGGRNFSQGTKANQPTWSATSALNSLPGLVFSSSSQYGLSSTAYDLFQSMPGTTMFAVFRPTTMPATEGRILTCGESGGPNNTLVIIAIRPTPVFRTGEKRVAGQGFVAVASDGAAQFGAARPVINQNYIMTSVLNTPSAQASLFVNQHQIVTNQSFQDAGNLDSAAISTLYIGGRLNASDRYLDGVISEILVYGKVLSQVERESVRDYLNTKWGGVY